MTSVPVSSAVRDKATKFLYRFYVGFLDSLSIASDNENRFSWQCAWLGCNPTGKSHVKLSGSVFDPVFDNKLGDLGYVLESLRTRNSVISARTYSFVISKDRPDTQ